MGESDGRSLEILNVREQVQRTQGRSIAATQAVGRTLARPWIFFALLLTHVAWIVLNAGIVPGITPWDPSPFPLLATIASVESPFIALLVLMRQHRDQQIAQLRDEVALQVALYVDRRTAALLRLAHGDESPEVQEVQALKREVNPQVLLRDVQEHLAASEDEPEPGQ